MLMYPHPSLRAHLQFQLITDNHLLEDIIDHKLIVVVLKRRRKTVTSFVLWYHVTLHCDPAFREIQKLLLVPKLKDLQGFEE